MKFFPKLSVLLALSIALLFPIAAFAHRPDWNASVVTQIPDIDVSYAFYRELSAPGEAHAFVFTADAGQRLHAGISIPVIERLRDYNVHLALFGPGLPELSSETNAVLPDGYPLEAGMLYIEPASSEGYSEPFTQTEYWGRQELDVDLAESGEYTLLVWNPDGQPGKYVLDTGREEVFGLSDVLRMPVWWVRARLFFEQGIVLALLALGFVAALAAYVWRSGSRQPSG